MNLVNPFGERSFEREKSVLGADWSDCFFEHAPFNRESLKPKIYLIVGRRGCGKSSLAEYFKSQTSIPGAICIHIDEAEAYNEEFFRIAAEVARYQVRVIESLSDLWIFCIWQVIFRQFGSEDPRIEKASLLNAGGNPAPNFLSAVLRAINGKYTPSDASGIAAFIQSRMSHTDFVAAQQAILERTTHRPVILTVDSKEQFRLGNSDEMRLAAALVQGACTFNLGYSRYGLHVKAFLTDEIFPHVRDSFIIATAKYVCEPLFLHWQPQDLLRLACWRFLKYLRQEGLTEVTAEEIDWQNSSDVYAKLWVPYFGERIENSNGAPENTLTYILRHTQLRPRQMIMICNKIADMSSDDGSFPNFSSVTIRSAVRSIERELADEVFNSYREVYPQVASLISTSLSGFPMEFKGSELNKVAHRVAQFWPEEWNPARLRTIVTELGIVGRRRGNRDGATGIVEADFEFALQDQLLLNEQDDCYIHPMFYRKLNIQLTPNTIVHPFPDRLSFAAMEQNR